MASSAGLGRASSLVRRWGWSGSLQCKATPPVSLPRTTTAAAVGPQSAPLGAPPLPLGRVCELGAPSDSPGGLVTSVSGWPTESSRRDLRSRDLLRSLLREVFVGPGARYAHCIADDPAL
eukprot:scaffold1991_cov357-Prasinococcus_capsulatus_cf.AAC.3